MSRYIDINQLLGHISQSTRSAGDPWTLSRSDRRVVENDSFNPAVVADLGAPRQNVSSDVQNSERISQANMRTSTSGRTPAEGSSPSGGGFLGGLLNFFPLASGIAKLFGLGESSTVAAQVPYQMPPAISFEGTAAGSGTGETSLSYGADGLPRSTSPTTAPAVFYSAPVSSNFTSVLDRTLSAVVDRYTGNRAADLGQLATTNLDVAGAGGGVETEFSPFSNSYGPGADLLQTPILQRSAGPLLTGDSRTGTDGNRSGTSSMVGQQGQSVLVQVQAMDSQSFMDHSHEIAQAVRQAMLNLNSLNDVIVDL